MYICMRYILGFLIKCNTILSFLEFININKIMYKFKGISQITLLKFGGDWILS